MLRGTAIHQLEGVRFGMYVPSVPDARMIRLIVDSPFARRLRRRRTWSGIIAVGRRTRNAGRPPIVPEPDVERSTVGGIGEHDVPVHGCDEGFSRRRGRVRTAVLSGHVVSTKDRVRRRPPADVGPQPGRYHFGSLYRAVARQAVSPVDDRADARVEQPQQPVAEERRGGGNSPASASHAAPTVAVTASR